MPAARWLVLIVLGWPLAELAAFLAVAAAIGLGPALAIVVLTSVVGALVLRYGGGSHIARFRVALNDAGGAGLHADGAGFLILLAGILLLLPGFISDALGLLLLVPAARRQLGRRLQRAFAGPGGTSPDTVDLERDQWRRLPESQIEERRSDSRNP